MTSLEQFNEAVARWENNSDTSQIIEVLKPAAEYFDYEIVPSNQKGCDCTMIEVNWNPISPMDDVESGEAIMLMVRDLDAFYHRIEIAMLDKQWTVAAHHFGGPKLLHTGPSLALTLLRCLLEHATRPGIAPLAEAD